MPLALVCMAIVMILPFKETANVDTPISLYAATKKAMSSWHIPTAIYISLKP